MKGAILLDPLPDHEQICTSWRLTARRFEVRVVTRTSLQLLLKNYVHYEKISMLFLIALFQYSILILQNLRSLSGLARGAGRIVSKGLETTDVDTYS